MSNCNAYKDSEPDINNKTVSRIILVMFILIILAVLIKLIF